MPFRESVRWYLDRYRDSPSHISYNEKQKIFKILGEIFTDSLVVDKNGCRIEPVPSEAVPSSLSKPFAAVPTSGLREIFEPREPPKRSSPDELRVKHANRLPHQASNREGWLLA